MIGRYYVDALAAMGEWDAIDRIITAQRWCFDDLYDGEGGACIRGHVHGIRSEAEYESARKARVLKGNVTWETATPLNRLAFPFGHDHYRCVPTRYNRLCQRFGMDRVVRAIKQRAGKHTRPDLGPTQPLRAALAKANGTEQKTEASDGCERCVRNIAS